MKNFYTLVIFFVALTIFAQCDVDHTCKWERDGHQYDFNPLTLKTSNYNYQDEAGVQYVWNVCIPTNTQNDCACCTSGKYNSWTRHNTTCRYWGEYSNGEQYAYADPNNYGTGVKISNQVLSSLGHTLRSTAIYLFCNPNYDNQIISCYEQDSMPSHVQMNIATKYACRTTPTPIPTPTSDPTSCMTIQDNMLYDLRAVRGTYKYTDKDTKNQYWLSFCKNLDDVSGCSCCKAHVNTGYLLQNGACTELGDLSTSDWMPFSDDPNEGVTLEYDKMDSLNHKKRSMKWDFVCDSDAKGEITEVIERSLTPPRTEITFTTKHACPIDPLHPSPSPTATVTTKNTSPSSSTGGLSGGYTFMVVVVCCIACFVFGLIVNKYRSDKKGNKYQQL
ncbi:lysosomal enzyme receptor protein [Anaeramoeba flamelloides]|uniref:Lysosomal enzyme receptor protein n=1 Tax=Anaeramoeba flamelloides TaxID=1746091 RepID=A0ABQ8XJG4_9EUKA|nr:lysosomal enzyme receptor protein [Anaeramoeba flamelloides]